MRFADATQPEVIRVGLSPNRHSALRELADALENVGAIRSAEELIGALGRSEEHYGSWAFMGRGCAWPHLKGRWVDRLWMAVGTSAEGIDWDAADGELVHFVFLFLCPGERPGEYLRLAEYAARQINSADFLKSLGQCRTAAEVWDLLLDADQTI